MKEASVSAGRERDLRRLVRAAFGNLHERIRDYSDLFGNRWEKCRYVRLTQVARMSGRSPVRH
jgi:hypothetical protein